MRISYHPVQSGDTDGGAVKCYSQIADILSRAPSKGHRTEQHNFWRLLRGSQSAQAAFVKTLGPDDLLISNVGPYAHFYHYLREKFGGEFRIIRDIRTSSWAGFWLQEFFAGPMTRPGDTVLFPSEFCRQHTINLFPKSLCASNTVVCYPLAASFPETVQRQSGSGLRVGFLGRISDGKNAPQLLTVVAKLCREFGGQTSLELAGPFDPHSRLPSERVLRRDATRLGIPETGIRCWGNLPYERVWDFLGAVDLLFFPSLANVESMGRILVEAARARLPVVAATYAAAPELVPRNNLIRTRYRIYKTWQTNGLFSFGEVDEDDAVTRLLHADLDDDISRRAEYQESAFWEVVEGNGGQNAISALDPVIKAFIRSAVVEPWREMNLQTSVQECGELLRRWQTTRIVGNQIILGNARRHCRQAGFEPTIELRPSVDATRLLVGRRP
jgi:glycosyltransferase involved in cell wall biosynthesis